MTNDGTPEAAAGTPVSAKRAYTTPRLERIGTMDDVRGNGAQYPNDASGSADIAAS